MDANCGTQSRLYYADANGILQGLEKEGDSEWVLSSVGDLNASVHPGTSINALLSPWADSIKVFYFKTGRTRPRDHLWLGGRHQLESGRQVRSSYLN